MKKKTAIIGAVLLAITCLALVSTLLPSRVGPEELQTDLEYELHEMAEKMLTQEYYASSSQEFLDSGTTIEEFWNNTIETNPPTINSSDYGIITTKETIVNCKNGYCVHEWSIKPSNQLIGLKQIRTTGTTGQKNILSQSHYLWRNTSITRTYLDGEINKTLKDWDYKWVPVTEVDITSKEHDEVLKIRTVAIIKKSLEYTVSVGDLSLDPFYNYSQVYPYNPNMEDGTQLNGTWWNAYEINGAFASNATGLVGYNTGSLATELNFKNFYNMKSIYTEGGIPNVSWKIVLGSTRCIGATTANAFTVCIYNEGHSDDCINNGDSTSDSAQVLWYMGWRITGNFTTTDTENRINITIDFKNNKTYCYSSNFGNNAGCQANGDTTMENASTAVRDIILSSNASVMGKVGSYCENSADSMLVIKEWNVTGVNIAPTQPVWNKPDNNSIIYTNQYFLNWTNSSDFEGDPLTYDLEIDNSSDFSSPEQTNNSITETESPTNYFVSGLKGGTLYSRVKAYDGTDYSSWSDTLTWSQDTAPVVEGENPTNNAILASSNVTFNCTSNDSLNIETIELWIDNVWNYSKIDGTTNVTSLEIGRVLTDGVHNYSCRANNTFEYAASANKTFTIFSVKPVITFSAPSTNNLLLLDRNITMSWSITNQSALSACWYRWEAVNSTFDCATTMLNLTNLPEAIADYNVTIHANTTSGLEGVKSNNFSVVAYSEAFFFNPTVYETAVERFSYNVTTDGLSSISASLVWDGTSYSSTNSGNITKAQFTRELVMPTSVTGSKTLYWELSQGSDTFQTQTNTQNLNGTVLCECNSPGCDGSPYLNYTFKDEFSSSILSGSIASSSWTFFVTGSGGGTTSSFFYSNSSENPSYAFCFEPSDELYTVSYVTQYEKAGYPQRRAGLSSLALTNATTDTILYLLNSSLGSYTTIQAQNPYGTPLGDVDIVASKLINNTATLIEQDLSGDDGGVTFWLNSNDDHTFTLVKEGYSTVRSTFRPTNPIYIIVMNPSTANGSFQSDLEGIDYSFRPSSGRVEKNTNYTFRLNVTSYRYLYDDLSELTNCTLRLYLQNGSTINTASGCTSGGDNISFTQNTGEYKLMFVAVGLAFGGEIIWVDKDGRVYTESFDIKPRGTLKSFFKYFSDSEELGEEDDRQTFSRLTLFFFLLTICLGVLSMKTGWDLATGGGGFFVVAIFTFIASYGGFLYVNATGFSFINQYLLAILAIFISIGYTISVMR